jgi:FSR family fosmidomycin resistance protein-like MFS transporter
MRRLVSPRLAVLSLAHLSIDAYASFFSPLLPLLVTKLGLSLTGVGALVALTSLASSLTQPLFGWLSDRTRRPWFVAAGPLFAALFLSSIGLAQSYGMLVALLMLGGLGSAAFHPQAASLAAGLGERRALALSFFVTGGTLGFSIGPLLSVGVVSAFGLERSWVAALPGLLIAGLVLFWFARFVPAAHPKGARPAFRELRPVARPLTLLYFCVVCRSATSYGFMTFLTLFLHARGFTVEAGGGLLAVYLGAGAMGSFLGGWLAERWGGRRVVVVSFLCATPLFFAFLILPTVPGLACLTLGAFMLQASLPVNVALGQELSPRHSSTISSLLMGAAWGLGALLIGPIGAIADRFGLTVALALLASLLPIGWLLALCLPDIRRHVAPAEIATPQALPEGA